MTVKNYEVKVTLKGFEKVIKRKLLINDNVKLETFCKAIISCMNGDLSHPYALKYKDIFYICSYMDKSDYDEIKMNSLRLSKLLLDVKDELELMYDFGDNWRFKITISKVLDGHNDKDFILVDGIGCGICDDCGGVCGLGELISNKDNDWDYDYDDFSIDKINEKFDKRYNIRRK